MGWNESIRKDVKSILCSVVLFWLLPVYAQTTTDNAGIGNKRLIMAGPQYARSPFHQFLWGKHYRKEWGTLVTVPDLRLDKIDGGLKPYEAGGGRQSNSLHLRNSAGKEYVLRSVDKELGKALPDIFLNTFVENIINDQVSIAHPYASLTVPQMAEAAKIYHCNPIIGFVPSQPALGQYNQLFGNNLYLFEQRADNNWEEAANFGNSKHIIGTEQLYQKISEGGDHYVDQQSFLRARLFDMFVGDWGRHEDQWRWAQFKKGNNNVYKAIPRDRDQAYTKFDGLLLKPIFSAAGLGHLQSFDYKIKNVAKYNFPARFIDRRLLNEPTHEQWINTAKDLQQLLTDTVIIRAIKDMPREVLLISGNEIVDKLRSRRDKLASFANDYYKFLAKEVEVVGTNNRDYFKIQNLSDSETLVQAFALDASGNTAQQPFYSRTFKSDETKEVRIFGIKGADVYTLDGNANNKMRVRIIGGIDRDSIINKSNTRLTVYDNPGNFIQTDSKIRRKLSNDTAINYYQYSSFVYDKKGISPIVFYNFEDRLFAGINYKIKNYKWRREPFANEHLFSVRYSISQKAFHYFYEGAVNEFIGKWNLSLNAGYDDIQWNNFFGIGNEVMLITKDRDYYRLRTHIGYGGLGLNRKLGNYHFISINGLYQSVQVVNDTDRYIAKLFAPGDKKINERKNFVGPSLTYVYSKVNDRLVPTKGLEFASTVSYTKNLTDKEKAVTRYTSELRFYIPLIKSLVWASRTAAATLNGEPEFYQLNSIGGNNSLRGYRRDRFWAKTSFFNSNELQLLFNLKSGTYNGRFGLVGLFDIGRVWHPDLKSDTWHTAIGGGIITVPFNRLAASLTYARSKENGLIHIRFLKPLGAGRNKADF